MTGLAVLLACIAAVAAIRFWFVMIVIGFKTATIIGRRENAVTAKRLNVQLSPYEPITFNREERLLVRIFFKKKLDDQTFRDIVKA